MSFKKEVDLAMGAIAISLARASVVDFSYPSEDGPEVSFMSHEPGQLPKAMGLLWPFTENVWICMGVGTIIVALSLCLVSRNLTVNYMSFVTCLKTYCNEAF
jgi:hypothetical protein